MPAHAEPRSTQDAAEDLTAAQARSLAAVLLNAADTLDGIAAA